MTDNEPDTANDTTAATEIASVIPSGITIEDNELPKSILTRIAKGALPDGAMIQKDAKTALSHASTVFINYLASW